MDLSEYVEAIRRQVLVAAEAGGDETKAAAERLLAPLDAAVRLALQDALLAAAEEITVELAPGSVDLRLRSEGPEFVVTPPGPDSGPADEESSDAGPGIGAGPDEDGGVARINLRLPEHLKARVEVAAAHDAMSVNSWLVRAAAAALHRGPHPGSGGRPRNQGGQRYTGWGR